MDIKEVIENIDNRVQCAMVEYNRSPEDDAYDEESLAIAIEAMKKQVPMKPDRLDGFRCRNCSGKLARQTDLVRQKYCHHCGQKIEWEGTNERDFI